MGQRPNSSAAVLLLKFHIATLHQGNFSLRKRRVFDARQLQVRIVTVRLEIRRCAVCIPLMGLNLLKPGRSGLKYDSVVLLADVVVGALRSRAPWRFYARLHVKLHFMLPSHGQLLFQVSDQGASCCE